MRRSAPAAKAALDPERLFGRLAAARGIVLAVSGGPDSTALMLLAARWAAHPPMLVVSVDHGLRPEAAAEARLVAANADRLGLPWRIMQAPARSSGNLQDWARRARYGCLATAAVQAGFDTLVTAHHQNDQAETFLLRLARGSGVYGLGGIPEESKLDGLRLVRPLLDVPRKTLVEIVEASGLAIVDDPSNRDLRFDRVRLRRLMPTLAEHGLTAKRLAETAGRLHRAGAALDHYAETLLRERFQADAFGVVSGPVAALTGAPEETGLRAVALVLQAVGGADYTPALDRVEGLRRAVLAASKGTDFKGTVAGVVLCAKSGRLTARREWGRNGLPAVAAPAGSTLLWDRRFQVEVPGSAHRATIAPLGNATRRLRSAAADRAAIRVMPGLFVGERLVAVPNGIEASDAGGPLASLPVRCVVAARLGLASEAVDLPLRSP
jgi:tRNA(Ile)-lysidine synthase